MEQGRTGPLVDRRGVVIQRGDFVNVRIGRYRRVGVVAYIALTKVYVRWGTLRRHITVYAPEQLTVLDITSEDGVPSSARVAEDEQPE